MERKTQSKAGRVLPLCGDGRVGSSSAPIDSCLLHVQPLVPHSLTTFRRNPPDLSPVPQILIAERCVLHTLGFQLTVEHPYSRVMSLLQKLFRLGKGADRGKGADKTLNRQLSQVRRIGSGFVPLGALVPCNGNASREAAACVAFVDLVACWTKRFGSFGGVVVQR